LGRFIPAALDQYRWIQGSFDTGGEAGTVYALPGDAQPYMFVYNKTMFDEAGQAYPDETWTWDDVVTAGQAITKADANKWGCYVPGFGSFCLEGEFVYSAGGSAISSDFKKSGLDTPETMSAFEWAWDLIYTDKVAPQPVPSEASNPFASGRVAMVWEGIWVLADYVQITDFEWDVAQHPKNPDTGKRTMSLQSDGWWAFKGTQDMDLAWSLVQFLVSDEAEQKFADLEYFIPPSLPTVAETWYAKKPPEHRDNALKALLADSKKFSGTYYESMSIFGAYSPELDKALYDGEPIEQQLQAAAQVMNEELDKAWAKFQA